MSGRPELKQAAFAELDLGSAPLELTGSSVAGLATWVVLRPWNIGIDCGVVTPQLVRCDTLLLTHGHLDHAGGVATWLAMRKLAGLGPSRIFAPAEICDVLQRIVDTWDSMHRRPFDWQLFPMAAGQRAVLNDQLTLEALEGDHVVPTRAWVIYQRKVKLRTDLRSKSTAEIRDLKLRGHSVSTESFHPLFAITGDARARLVREQSVFHEVPVAMVECTFLDDRCSPDKAREGGHTHLDELLEVPWNNVALVPYHISQRYSVRQARLLLEEKLSPRLSAEVLMQPLLPDED